jgi:hypothetical protein
MGTPPRSAAPATRGRVPRHRKPEQLSSTVAHDEKRKQTLECQRRNHAEIDRSDSFRTVAQECPLCDGGPRRRIMYLETVDSAISNPSLSSSPWMRGAPHNGFSLLMRWMSSRNSRLTLGLPGRPLDFQRQ